MYYVPCSFTRRDWYPHCKYRIYFDLVQIKTKENHAFILDTYEHIALKAFTADFSSEG